MRTIGGHMIRSVLRFAFSGFVALSLSCAHAGDSHEDGDEDSHGKFEFALIGDTPYRDVAQFENVLAAINANPKIKFVLHAGDIKTGSSACSDELFADEIFEEFKRQYIVRQAGSQ